MTQVRQTPAETESNKYAPEAYKLLRTIAEQVGELNSRDNRIYFGSAIADLLWSEEPKTARSLLDLITKEMGDIASAIDSGDPQALNDLGPLQEKRREILTWLTPRDPELALSFLKATRTNWNRNSASVNHYTEESNIELHVAGLLLDKDPQRALDIARKAMKHDVSYSVTQLLYQLAARKPALAQEFYKEIVAMLERDLSSQEGEAVNVTINVLNVTPPQVPEAEYKELLDALLTAAGPSSSPYRSYSSQNLLSQLPQLLPKVQQYTPARLSGLRQWAEQMRRTMDASSRMYQEIQEMTESAGVDEMLALVKKYPGDYHNQIYQQASWKALNNNDVDRAREIIKDFVKDPFQQKQMLDQLESTLVWKKVSGDNVAEARRMLGSIKNIEQRVQLMVNMATNAAGRGEKSLAVDLLQEAANDAALTSSSSAKLSMKLQIAEALAPLDQRQVIEMMRPLMAQLNDLIAAAVVLDGFENSYLQDGEWIKRNHTRLGVMVSAVEQTLGVLARYDFESATQLANVFQRSEVRLMSQLSIARSVLAGSGNPRFRNVLNSYPRHVIIH